MQNSEQSFKNYSSQDQRPKTTKSKKLASKQNFEYSPLATPDEKKYK